MAIGSVRRGPRRNMSFFNSAYRGIPPWDIGRPQRELEAVARRGEVSGDGIDVGCGTGENSLFLSENGHRVLGVDSAPLAIERAKEKAKSRGSKAEFVVWDALQLVGLGRKFETAIDCGLFHVFADRERRAYVSSLAEVIRPSGRLIMLCFSDTEPSDWGGPRRIARSEILDAFARGWRVNYVREATFETTQHADGARAWLSSISRV